MNDFPHLAFLCLLICAVQFLVLLHLGGKHCSLTFPRPWINVKEKHMLWECQLYPIFGVSILLHNMCLLHSPAKHQLCKTKPAFIQVSHFSCSKLSHAHPHIYRAKKTLQNRLLRQIYAQSLWGHYYLLNIDHAHFTSLIKSRKSKNSIYTLLSLSSAWVLDFLAAGKPGESHWTD